MLIDWFTVGAQLLNFIILIWLLKRFLYKPILNAIDAREKRIVAALSDADKKQADAERERDAFRQKNAQFDQQRVALFKQATDAADAERQRLIDAARQSADALSSQRQAALQHEHQRLHDEITQRTREEVFAIARKTLEELSGVSLEERISDLFVDRLHELSGEPKEILAIALKSASEPAVVRSAFELSEAQRAAIQNALNEIFADDIRIRFETAPAVISGIEISVNGHKFAWSIADYLKSLEARVDELLKAPAKIETQDKQP